MTKEVIARNSSLLRVGSLEVLFFLCLSRGLLCYNANILFLAKDTRWLPGRNRSVDQVSRGDVFHLKQVGGRSNLSPLTPKGVQEVC